MELPSRAFRRATKEGKVTESAIIARNQKWFRHMYIDRIHEPLERYAGKTMEIGKAYSFTYDAKYKDSLAFWDVLPHLMICIGHVKNAKGDGYNALGINFSYIPPKIRMAVLDKLVQTFNSMIIDPNRRRIEKGQINSLTELPVFYKVAKEIFKGSGFEFAIRSYIYKRIQTEPRVITYNDWWRVATFPTKFLKGMTIRQIYYLYKKNVKESYRVGQKEKPPKLKVTTQKEVKKLLNDIK